MTKSVYCQSGNNLEIGKNELFTNVLPNGFIKKIYFEINLISFSDFF